MDGHARWKTITLLVLVSRSLPLSTAATLNVPAGYPTIQACINAAVSGVDDCVVASGTYHETINLLGKAISVRSFKGAEVTIIDATEFGGSVVTCSVGEGPDTIIDGFTLTGGTGTLIGTRRYGGGMYNSNSGPTVTNCTFQGNRAYAGGGMINDHSNPTVRGCTFTLNTADDGGGMMNSNSRPTVTNCTFNENTAGDGGGVFNNFSNLIVNNSIFCGNRAVIGGGMENYVSSPMVRNCTFSGNLASGSGGGIANVGSAPTLTHDTFSENNASGSGGGIGNRGSSPPVTHCIFWRDIPDEVGNEASHPTIRFSDVLGGLPIGAVDGGGNIDVDPMFVRPPGPGPDGAWDGVDDDFGDLRLQAGSPCINAGDPGFVPLPGESDLDGHARILCGRVDMGAYEFGIGDYDCDQSIDLSDFAIWSTCMTGPQSGPYDVGCEIFDYDADSAIDLLDFAQWQRLFIVP